jgi:hypothetical protein
MLVCTVSYTYLKKIKAITTENLVAEIHCCNELVHM